MRIKPRLPFPLKLYRTHSPKWWHWLTCTTRGGFWYQSRGPTSTFPFYHGDDFDDFPLLSNRLAICWKPNKSNKSVAGTSNWIGSNKVGKPRCSTVIKIITTHFIGELHIKTSRIASVNMRRHWLHDPACIPPTIHCDIMLRHQLIVYLDVPTSRHLRKSLFMSLQKS